jgi:hypothetical protein
MEVNMNELTVNEIKIENMIYEIRGKQVMLDSDLAKLYQVETKRINEAVKNNPDKFPNRYILRISEKEYQFLKSKISTSKGGSRKGHTAFTEQGVAMLATILKSNIATKVSIRIMDAFVAMRHYIGNNEYRLSNVEAKVLEHDNDIKLLQESFKKFEEKKKNNEIYFNGQIFDAYSKILDIFKDAKKELTIIDAYADNTILDIIKRLNVQATIITKKDNLLTNQDIQKYNQQYHNLKIIFNNTFHDRYFILDNDIVYHCGTSINRLGYKTFSITKMNDKDVCNLLINKIKTLN